MVKVSGGVALVGAVLVLGVSGCSSPAAAPGAAAVKAAPSPSKPAPLIAAFPATLTFPEGVAVTVVSAARYKMSRDAQLGWESKVGIKVVVRVANRSAAPLNTEKVDVRLRTAAAAGVDAFPIVDSVDKIGSFVGSVAPGGSASATFGFAVEPTELGRMAIHVDVPGSPDTALFEGSVK